MKLGRAGLGCWVLALLATAATAQFPGSIQTADSTAAPQDLFSDRQDVYLAAGSASTPCGAALYLADGQYYFQVTDAKGERLLSTDPVSERLVTVVNGVIASYDGTAHATGGSTACGSLAVSLSPFDDAGDRKAAYVVWMTPAGEFLGEPTDVSPVCGDGCFFGFAPVQSVLHPFRVEDKRNCEPSFCASGTVFSDANGDGTHQAEETGLPGVAIRVTGPTGIALSGISAADGSYQVCGLTSSDTWLVNETAPNGYTQTGPKDRRISRSLIAKDLGYIALVCCRDFPGLDFGNQLIPGAVGGFVYEDLNANGARDPGEPPFSGVTVTLTPTDPAGDPQTAVSSADGSFLFTTLPAGIYILTQNPPAGFTQTQPPAAGYAITLGSGGSSLNNDFGNFRGTPTGTLSGFVFNDLNGNGVRDPGEPGMAGVTVVLGVGPVPCFVPPPGSCPQLAVTAADGSYQFTGVPFGTQTLSEIIPVGFKQTAPPPPGRITATLDFAHQNIGDLLFGNQALLGRAFGSVFVDANGNGTLDAGEGPQSGVTVQAVNTGSGQTATTTSAADGTFSFDGLTPGTYTLSEIPPPGYVQTAPPPPGTFTVTAAAGDSKGPYLFGNRLAPATGSIAGDKWIDFNENGVVDGVDYPLQGIVFILTDSAGQQRTATSDANGNYSFTSLPPGTYDLKEVLPPGFWQTFPGTKTQPLGYTIILGVDEHKTGFRFLNKC